ncbi:Crp/Fnr family transcriptional regulator [Amycolatopsis sp. CA-128772]|uniref:Crp/Fnr family transcriptional regulator n=1 Tax=Amycolatopsis sp. CA-128772 TaxID=2073159 RepID=UPI000CD045A0|nr:Crp/Fnr family transcriptional regulator [Amycolatopsis sp. CA-128772]
MDGAQWSPNSVLARLSGPARAALLALGTEVTVPAGRRILHQGEDGDTVYVLLAGAVKVTAVEGDREPLLAVRGAGDLVGEMSVLLHAPRSAGVVTCGTVVARVVPGTNFRAYLRTFPEAAIEVAGMLGDRLRWANARRIDIAALDAAARVRRVLVALAEAHGRAGPNGHELGAPLTQEDIATLAGVRLNTAEKTLRALSRANVVRLGYRNIVVRDLDGLRDSVLVPGLPGGNGEKWRA